MLERLDQKHDQQTGTASKMRLVEQINSCLRASDYTRALDFLRNAAEEFPNDAELSGLEKLAHDGVKRKAEADRLITESQELFAQRKSGEALQLLRKAYELDKKNSLARAILANALVEHAHSIVESDWLEAETLTNQALGLNPAHPTAKTILNLIVDQKKTSSVEDWVSQARKLQSSGDLFRALAWVAEGLAVHPNDSKLLQTQDAIQRDQGARRRQDRRRDVDDLRRMEREIDGTADTAAKQALADRIQALAAKYWTDGEILSIANGLLQRLGFASQENSTASRRGKVATVIFHVPRPSAPTPSRAETGQIPPNPTLPNSAPTTLAAPSPPLPSDALRNEALPTQLSPNPAPSNQVPPSPAAPSTAPPAIVPAGIVPPSKIPLKAPPQSKKRIAPPELQLSRQQAAAVLAVEPPVPAVKATSSSPNPDQPARSNSTTLIFGSAAILLVAATFFFTRRHYASSPAKSSETIAAVSAPPASTAPASAPTVSVPAVPAPAPAETIPEPASFASSPSSNPSIGKGTPEDQPAPESAHDFGTLLVVAGQDDARVFLNGKLQPQLTRTGQLRVLNLPLKDYVVQVSKSGFQDPPQQTVRIRKSEQSTLFFNLQPQPHLASLTIQGGTPGTAVFVDQTPVGAIQPDGTLSVSTLNPGDHTVELRKERFKTRQFQKHFVAGATISLSAADAALEGAPGELKITFTPADAKVAVVKGDLLKMVNSGVPLNLAAGTYTLTARTADRITRSATLELVAGQSKTLDLSLAPNGMSKWDDPGAWKQEGDSFTRKGGDFVLFGVAPASGTFVFSAMITKGHVLQWVYNYTDPRNYVLLQLDDNNFYRSVIRNGEKTDQIIVPHKGDKKSFRTLQIRVSPTELVHQIKSGESWTFLDRWTQPGANLGQGKFGFYIPGNDQVVVSSFAHYADLNTH